MTYRNATRTLAEGFLYVWGDCLRARAEGVPYIGNMDAGQFKPEDDPHPHAFIICQVETCLNGLKDRNPKYGWLYHHLAFHLWCERKHSDSFRDANLEVMPGSRDYKIRKLRSQIVNALVKEIEKRELSTISERAIAEARMRLNQERAAGRMREVA